MKYLILLVILFQSCRPPAQIIITQFSTLNKVIDTSVSLGKERIYYNKFFLVSNYANSKKVEKEIDSFVVVFTSGNNYHANTAEIRLYFYKETSKTNLAVIKQNPRDIDRYSNEHDLIYYYAVKLDGTFEREKYKQGEIIENTAEQIPKPKFRIEPR